MTDEELAWVLMCPYDTASEPEEIMPCVQDENVQSPVTAEECNKCMKEWLEKRSGN